MWLDTSTISKKVQVDIFMMKCIIRAGNEVLPWQCQNRFYKLMTSANYLQESLAFLILQQITGE